MDCWRASGLVVHIRHLPLDPDVRVYFLERLRETMKQYGALLSEDEQGELCQFYEDREQSIEAHRVSFPEYKRRF